MSYLPKALTSDISSVRAAGVWFPSMPSQVTLLSPDLVTPGHDTQTQMSLLPSPCPVSRPSQAETESREDL